MLSNKFGHAFDRPLRKIAQKIPFSPNTLSVAGFVITLFACYRLSFDFLTGGIFILVGALFDVLDGVVARTQNKMTRFGAFLDSVLDRYSDAFILLAIAYNLKNDSNTVGIVLCLGALVGAFLISLFQGKSGRNRGRMQKRSYGKTGEDNSYISWCSYRINYPGIMGFLLC